MHGLGAEDKLTEFSNYIKEFEMRACTVLGSWLNLSPEKISFPLTTAPLVIINPWQLIQNYIPIITSVTIKFTIQCYSTELHS